VIDKNIIMVFHYSAPSVLVISFIETNKVNNQILWVLNQVSLPLDINLIFEVFFALASHPIRRKNLIILSKNLLKALIHAFMRRRDYQVDVSLKYFLEFMMASGTAHQIHCVKPEILHYKRISFFLFFM
jgi:hypothetical protein